MKVSNNAKQLNIKYQTIKRLITIKKKKKKEKGVAKLNNLVTHNNSRVEPIKLRTRLKLLFGAQ